MEEGDGLLDLEDRVHKYSCAAQAGEDRVAGGAPLLDCDVKVNCGVDVLDG